MFQLTLKELREQYKISQVDLAKRLNVSPSTVGMWESGKNKPEFDTLVNISKIFNVSMNFLMGIKDDEGIIKVPIYSTPITLASIKQIKEPDEYKYYNAHCNGSGYIGYKISEDKYHPYFFPGDIFIINLSMTVKTGDLVAVTYNGSRTSVKYVTFAGNGYILSSVSNLEAPEYFTTGDMDKYNVEIVGVVEEVHKILCK